MRNIREQVGPHRIRDLAEARPIHRPRVGRIPRDNELWLGTQRQLLHRIVIDLFRHRIDRIMHRIEKLARAVHRRAVRQVPAVQQVQPHDRLPRLHQRMVHRVVRRRPRERLHVHVQVVCRHLLGGKQLCTAPPRQLLRRIGILHPFIIAPVGIAPVMRQPGRKIQRLGLHHPARLLAWVALCIDILKSRSQRLAHCHWRLALARDQDQLAELPLRLQLCQLINSFIQIGQTAAKQKILHNQSS